MNKKVILTGIISFSVIMVVVVSCLSENKQHLFELDINKNRTEPRVVSVVDFDGEYGQESITTYRSPYGYEISYPEGWIGDDITSVYYKKDALNVYMIKPQEVADPYVQDHIMTISVEEKTLENFKKEVDLGHDIRIENFDELMPVSLNGLDGLYKPFENQESFYFFEKDGRLYSLHLHYDEAININKQESLSVLSTFKILE